MHWSLICNAQTRRVLIAELIDTDSNLFYNSFVLFLYCNKSCNNTGVTVTIYVLWNNHSAQVSMRVSLCSCPLSLSWIYLDLAVYHWYHWYRELQGQKEIELIDIILFYKSFVLCLYCNKSCNNTGVTTPLMRVSLCSCPLSLSWIYLDLAVYHLYYWYR